MTWRGWRGVAAMAMAGAVVVGSAWPASAAEDGLWYVDALGIPAANAAGHTGEGAVVAVIDGQINPEVPTLQGADLRVREPSFCMDENREPIPATSMELSEFRHTDHGTNIVSMIVGNGDGYPGQSGVVGIAPEATVLYYAVSIGEPGDGVSCRFADEDFGDTSEATAAAMEEAMDAGADIISVSLSLDAPDSMVTALARAFREGVIVIGSLRNTTEFVFTTGIPGSANGAIGVQAIDANAVVQSTDGVSHADSQTDVLAPGIRIITQGSRDTGSWEDQTLVAGTSIAVPLVAGALALAKQTFPDATGNQLIQSLIRNTAGEPDHEPEYDPGHLFGYGVLSLKNLLAVDPTQYPDVNPLIKEIQGPNDVLIPTWDEIFNPVEVEPTTPPTEPEPEADNDLPLGIFVGIGVGVLLLAALIVLIVVLATRKSRAEHKDSTNSGSMDP